MAPVPGIIFANSRISDDILDAETFRTWYEEVHIPDVLATSGVATSFRYQSPDPQHKRPYLAVYPLQDMEWLSTGEFFKIPLTSDVLPNPSKHIFDVTDFDIRFFETLESVPGPGARKSSDSVMIVAFDLEEADAAASFREGLRNGAQPVHSTLFKRYDSDFLPPREAGAPKLPQYLAVYEFEALPEDTWVMKDGSAVLKFKHLRAFGDKEIKW